MKNVAMMSKLRLTGASRLRMLGLSCIVSIHRDHRDELVVLTGVTTQSLARTHHHRAHHAHIHAEHHHKFHHHSKVKKVASIAAPIAIGAAFGPAGSVSYQVVKHRKAIKRHLVHRGQSSEKLPNPFDVL